MEATDDDTTGSEEEDDDTTKVVIEELSDADDNTYIANYADETGLHMDKYINDKYVDTMERLNSCKKSKDALKAKIVRYAFTHRGAKFVDMTKIKRFKCELECLLFVAQHMQLSRFQCCSGHDL